MPTDTTLIAHAVICTGLALMALAIPAVRNSRSALAMAGALALAATLKDRALGMLVAVAGVYLGTMLIRRLASRVLSSSAVQWRAALALIALIVVGFTALRLTGSESLAVEVSVGRVVVLALDMWLVLRLVTFVWETGAGKTSNHRPFDFAAWALNPFTLIGPVLRFSELGAPAAGATSLTPIHVRRLLLGAVQMAGGYALAGAQSVVANSAEMPKFAKFGLWSLLFGPWSYYLTMAGYFKVMECCALAWGISIPPSFDQPFGQKNLADFWARWNITATRVFRDYAFYVRWGRQRPNVYVNTMIVFVLVGLWHAANIYWLLWGTLHGVGFCVCLAFRRFGTPIRKRFAWIPENVRSGLAIATTYVFVCACWAAPSWLIRQGSSVTAMIWRWIS